MNILYVAYILTYLVFAFVLYMVYYLLLLKTSVTLKMGINFFRKLSILCYEVAASDYNKLKHIFTKYMNKRTVY